MTHFYDTDNGPFRNRDVSVVTNGKKEAGAAGNNRRRETRERTNTNTKDHHVVTEKGGNNQYHSKYKSKEGIKTVSKMRCVNCHKLIEAFIYRLV